MKERPACQELRLTAEGECQAGDTRTGTGDSWRLSGRHSFER